MPGCGDRFFEPVNVAAEDLRLGDHVMTPAGGLHVTAVVPPRSVDGSWFVQFAVSAYYPTGMALVVAIHDPHDDRLPAAPASGDGIEEPY
jgi:hypothetical protein